MKLNRNKIFKNTGLNADRLYTVITEGYANFNISPVSFLGMVMNGYAVMTLVDYMPLPIFDTLCRDTLGIKDYYNPLFYFEHDKDKGHILHIHIVHECSNVTEDDLLKMVEIGGYHLSFNKSTEFGWQDKNKDIEKHYHITHYVFRQNIPELPMDVSELKEVFVALPRFYDANIFLKYPIIHKTGRGDNFLWDGVHYGFEYDKVGVIDTAMLQDVLFYKHPEYKDCLITYTDFYKIPIKEIEKI